MQDLTNNNKIKENKYKILRMSLLLGSGENQEETLTNFEESAREIDEMNDETYLKDLETKFYDTLTLEEEEKKLSSLVDYIGGRVEQRISLLSDFSNVTGYDLGNLPSIKYYDKLDDYKDRLKYIREYLSNTKEIKELTKKQKDAEQRLKEAYLSKSSAEDYNIRNEEIILNKFETMIKSTALKDINESNIDEQLANTNLEVEDSKKSLDIFNKSYNTLSTSGISQEEKDEYKSYVDNAKEIYYRNKEQEYLLTIYKSLLEKKSDFSAIIEKREYLNNILSERKDLRRELNVTDVDILSSLYDLLERQFNEIRTQKENIELIDSLSRNIESYKTSLNELELDNQKVEILALLREFCLIDTYSDNKEIENTSKEPTTVDIEDKVINNDIKEEKQEEVEKKEEEIIPTNIFAPIKEEEPITPPVITETPKDNEVILVEDATNIDLDFVHAKAGKVMQRVGDMLGIKTTPTEIVTVEEAPKVEIPSPFTNEVKEENVENTSLEFTNNKTEEKTVNTENPLFGNTEMTNPLFDNEKEVIETEKKEEEINNDFWFSSDQPDALNALPDLEEPTNNLFANNSMPDLNFPDLNLGFNPNDSKEETK